MGSLMPDGTNTRSSPCGPRSPGPSRKPWHAQRPRAVDPQHVDQRLRLRLPQVFVRLRTQRRVRYDIAHHVLALLAKLAPDLRPRPSP